MTWLVTFWAKKKKGTGGYIDARMEPVAHKASFMMFFCKKRCLIIADGYYERKTALGKNKKNRYHFQLPSKIPSPFAGLWDNWKKEYHGCTIITQDAVGDLKGILLSTKYIIKNTARKCRGL